MHDDTIISRRDRGISDERCDKCHVAAAKSRLDLDTGGTLYLCGHHTAELFPETGVYVGMTFTYAPVTL